ncbi:hypothetical protein DFP73DRAFT_608497 [Morchella snyderi]|nr:hypothetical protein DFP73DRAFT_608497 [Morchella snyderi]
MTSSDPSSHLLRTTRVTISSLQCSINKLLTMFSRSIEKFRITLAKQPPKTRGPEQSEDGGPEQSEDGGPEQSEDGGPEKSEDGGPGQSEDGSEEESGAPRYKPRHRNEMWGQNISEESDRSLQEGLGEEWLEQSDVSEGDRMEEMEEEMEEEMDESDGTLSCAVPPSTTPYPSISPKEATTSVKKQNHTGKGSDLSTALERITRTIKEQRRKLKRNAGKVKEQKENLEWDTLKIKEIKRKLKRNALKIKKRKERLKLDAHIITEAKRQLKRDDRKAELKLLKRITREQ